MFYNISERAQPGQSMPMSGLFGPYFSNYNQWVNSGNTFLVDFLNNFSQIRKLLESGEHLHSQIIVFNFFQMKTVSGKIVSTKPVNLSKAANILSNFVTIENGASQSVSTYLRRASVAFNELVYFKKHHKLKKKRTKGDVSERNLEDDEVRVVENGTGKVEGELRKNEKKKKKRDGSMRSWANYNVEEGKENVKEKSEEKKKKKKKRKNEEEIDGGEVGNVATLERKKKRRRTEGNE